MTGLGSVRKAAAKYEGGRTFGGKVIGLVT